MNFLLPSVVGQRICLIGIPPKSCMLQKIVIENMVNTKILICTQIVYSSFLTGPYLWDLSNCVLPMYRHHWVV